VLKDMFVSGLPGLLGIAVHPQWFRSFQLCTRFSLQPHAFDRCFAFPKSFLVKCLVLSFCSLSSKIPSASFANRILWTGMNF